MTGHADENRNINRNRVTFLPEEFDKHKDIDKARKELKKQLIEEIKKKIKSKRQRNKHNNK